MTDWTGATLIAYGDSYTSDNTHNTPGQRAIQQLTSRLGLGTVTNHAQAGDMIGDGAEKSIGGTGGRFYVPGASDLVLSHFTNDLKSTDTAQKRSSLLHYLRAHYAVLSAAERIEESTATKTGSWGTNSGAWFPSGGENASTTANGATATFTVTTPGRYVQLFFGTRGSVVGGIFTVTQGGVTLGTIDTDETVSQVERNANSVGPIALDLGTLAAGSVVVTFSTAGRSGATGFLDALVRIDETAPPTILAVKPVTVTYASYVKPDLLAAIRAAIDTVATEYDNVIVCDPLPGWNTATMLGADGLHPNDAGMTHIADAMEAALTPPNPPAGLTQTGATPVTVDVAWTAPATGAAPASYEVRVDGGTPVDVGLVTTHTLDTLTPATAYTVEVRSVAATGASAWVSVEATTAEVSGEGVALEAGHDYGTQLLDDTYSITIRRSVRANGVTDDLEPATFTAIIKGSDTLNPLTNDDVRPNRPIRLRATLDGGATWATLWTGRISRARLTHDPEEKDDAGAYRLALTGTDLVAELTGIPSDVAVDGNLHQRVGAVLDPTGLPYVVDDPSTPGAAATLPTDARDVLGQLRLIRDTAHALMYVNRDGELAVIADNARPRVAPSPDWIATDEDATPGIHYTEVDPALDTDAVVNVLTIALLDGAGNPETIHTDETSRDAWGDKAQTVAVNDGVPETHADLWLASRVDPELVPESIRFIVQRRLTQALEPTVDATHLAAAAGVELYDVVRVTRDGMPTTDLLIREITHAITPTAWAVGLGLRVPEVLATRWDDVPADLTWDDVPADLTWDTAVHWHPYL
jgi:hypothetical protein